VRETIRLSQLEYAETMIRVYFDFVCPFAWRGVELLSALEIPFEPRHYSLVQGNHAENAKLPRSAPAWKLSEQPIEGEGYLPDSLEAFLASHAAKLQGQAPHQRFILELFRARHRDSKPLNGETALEAAKAANLEISAFQEARVDEAARRAELENDTQMAGNLGVFGTPTVQLESGAAAYLRFAKLPESRAEQESLWAVYQGVLEHPAQIETVKRPR
jgi:predicted DsbA family dithiol-disulfide isomerase